MSPQLSSSMSLRSSSAFGGLALRLTAPNYDVTAVTGLRRFEQAPRQYETRVVVLRMGITPLG